ncbi:MAG: MarR family transcriptional regulator [Bacteroidota bacterium]
MEQAEERINRLTEAMKYLIIKMQEVDATCVELCEDITKKDLCVIDFIGGKGEVIMRDIAEYLNVPVSTTTGIIDKLVDKKYLRRYHSTKDRRIVKVSLADRGKQTFALAKKHMFQLGEKILGDLNAQDQEELIDLLERVTNNLNRHIPVASGT